MKKMLIVDDVNDLRIGLVDIFNNEGFEVYEAENGNEAMKIIDSTAIDILVTDILMPEMDGIELTKAAKQKLPNLRTIAISGGGRQLKSSQDIDYLKQSKTLAGVDEILKKPFQPTEIIQLVKNLSD